VEERTVFLTGWPIVIFSDERNASHVVVVGEILISAYRKELRSPRIVVKVVWNKFHHDVKQLIVIHLDRMFETKFAKC
jgi:pyoverdine/dityrosine biosynthesis protein Dit1